MPTSHEAAPPEPAPAPEPEPEPLGGSRPGETRPRGPLHVRVRRSVGYAFQSVLASVRGPRLPPEPLDPAEIQRVLIVRLNRRLGNTVLLSPLVRYVGQMFPRAGIDLLIGEPAFAPVLERLPGVERVLALSPAVWGRPREVLQIMRVLRSGYDLAIDAVPRSTNGRLACGFARARRRLGFPPESEWAPTERHAARVPLELLDRVRPRGMSPQRPRVDIALDQAEIRAGQKALASQLADQDVATKGRRVVGFFVDARGDKLMSLDWWTRWRDALLRGDDPPVLVQLVPPGGQAFLDGIAGVSSPDVRVVGALLRALDAFVSLDSGPMHLGSACGVPTIGLFTTTDPAVYGPQGPRDLVLRIVGMEPELVAERVRTHVRGLQALPTAAT